MTGQHEIHEISSWLVKEERPAIYGIWGSYEGGHRTDFTKQESERCSNFRWMDNFLRKIGISISCFLCGGLSAVLICQDLMYLTTHWKHEKKRCQLEGFWRWLQMGRKWERWRNIRIPYSPKNDYRLLYPTDYSEFLRKKLF